LISYINNLKFVSLLFLFLFFDLNILAKRNFVLIQSTTSTRDSGLYDFLIPKFNELYSIEVRVVAVGTGQAIENAKRCNADILLVHHKKSEEDFILKGYGAYRKDLMYNDFVLVGPKSDPANLKGRSNIRSSLRRIYNQRVVFISRADNSGTHKKEIELWKKSGISVNSLKNSWYLETGSGMGTSLNIAVNKSAYILSDRATWISFNNKKNHEILVENEPLLYNQYGISLISKKRCKNVNTEDSEVFINWLLSKNGKEAINSYRVNGQQLFKVDFN
tara:strand:- start:121 stop:948 length:828 start_codon:yes stop_codon:yes gene_type:complete